MNLFPAKGMFISWRGKILSRKFRCCGKNLKMSSRINVYNPDMVSIGDNVYIGYSTYLGGGDIHLKDEVIIGPFCSIVAGNHTAKNDSFRFGPYDYGKIEVGEGTWLGSHVVITNNVKIGKGCLIGAGSVVTEDVPDFCFAAGSPARIIRKLKP